MFSFSDKPHRSGFLPLLRQKKSILSVAAIVFIIYVFYNLYFLSILSMEQKSKALELTVRENMKVVPKFNRDDTPVNVVLDNPSRHNERKYRGVLLKELHKYLPDSEGMFTCIFDSVKITHKWLNDDYCDCLDGSDEPGTNACPDSIFYCDYQPVHKGSIKKYSVPTSRVNDGICDCCDGSDEWASVDSQYELLGRLQINGKLKCHNICSK